MFWLTRLDLHSSYVGVILPAFVVMSVGMGLVFVPMSNTALDRVANHDAGVASALVNTSQQVGGSLGTALLNTIFTTAVAGYLLSHGTTGVNAANAAIHGYNVAFLVSALLMAGSAVVAFTFIRKAKAPSDAPVLAHVG
jgi:MFS family permease